MPIVAIRSAGDNMPLSKELQTYIDDHVTWSPGSHIERIRFLALAFAGEAGELTGPIKKHWRGDKKATYVWMMEEVRKEMADCGNYLYMLAKELGLDLEEEMLSKFKEVELRPEYIAAHEDKLCTCGHAKKWHQGPNMSCDYDACMYFEERTP